MVMGFSQKFFYTKTPTASEIDSYPSRPSSPDKTEAGLGGTRLFIRNK